eukprot:TRINITY_DN68134_c4_g9_i1.p1 TRINITY_DN68134_c4_g9~~TRINITY_DN68134_c4_g9_i1.p1  ORF type:complete len:310 (+),score=16.06 TRINITY_DN68134_c4_g9_i1:82-1011(+)
MAFPTWAKIASVVLCIGILLMVILIPISFHYVERNRWAFKKNSITNDVDTSKVYSNGRYFWGIGRTSVTFPSTFQHVEFTGKRGLSVFTEAGLELLIDMSFQYRLQPDTLAQLFQTYGLTYASQIENIARAALRNEAPRFDIDQYITDRSTVVKALHLGLQVALAEIWVDVPESKFQLRRVVLPEQVRDKFLNTFVQKEINKEKGQKQRADLIRKETEKMEQVIRGNITIITNRADATATRMVEEERATSAARLDIAKARVVKDAMDTLEITDSKDKALFLEYIALMDGKNPKFMVGVDGAIINMGGAP